MFHFLDFFEKTILLLLFNETGRLPGDFAKADEWFVCVCTQCVQMMISDDDEKVVQVWCLPLDEMIHTIL